MKKIPFLSLLIVFGVCLMVKRVQAQTADDAIMMNKKQWCNGLTYMYSGWNKYWEGTKKRSNENMGTVTNESVTLMSNYGITDKFNVLASVPYVWTHASQGTLHGLQGVQDLGLDLKYEFYSKPLGKGTFSLIGVGGFSTPLTNYENDFLPMSIGLGSTHLSARLTADYQLGIFFATLSSSYIWRSNVSIDRTAYYTDEIHNTDQVYMANQLGSNFFAGIRKSNLIVQAQVYNLYTFGGTDIRINDFPFAGNQMNMTSVGAHVKYFIPFVPNLQVVASADYVVAGRNVGQSKMYAAGLYYIVSLKK